MVNLLRNSIFFAIGLISPIALISQAYAPQVRFAGSTAIAADSGVFVEWAKKCYVRRGYIDIADTTKTDRGSNRASFGSDSLAIGKAGGTMDVVSLGDKGEAVLSFDEPIKNGESWDFAVFENGFMQTSAESSSFLELAFVEVSTDSVHFVRFPAVSLTNPAVQTGAFGTTDARNIHNLAGKYIANYGTPFDLEDLKDSSYIDLNNIRYVRIVDVGGSVDARYASYDSQGHIINDPFPTAFWSGGFDLDAVGVIHCAESYLTKSDKLVNLYPNPADDFVYLQSKTGKITSIIIFDLTGKEVYKKNGDKNFMNIYLKGFSKGLYLMRIQTRDKVVFKKFLKQ